MTLLKRWYIEGNNLVIVDADKDIPDNAITPTLACAAPELLEALINLQSKLHEYHKMNVKKDYSLMVADAQASNAIYHAKGER